MAANIERFKDDLDRLIRQSEFLDCAMLRDLVGDERYKRVVLKNASDEQADQICKNLPNFKLGYEAWYSEALAVIRQILPSRAENFISHYERSKNRKSVDYGNYVIQDYMQGIVVKFGGEVKADGGAAIPQFRQQCAILRAAKARFASSLFEIKQVVQADLFDSELEAARELLKNKFVRAAGMIAGVVLEKHLRQVCDDHKVSISKKNPGIGDFNEVLKANSVIDVPQWRHISMLGDIRNVCGHNKDKEPTADQVKDLIEGVIKIIKTTS